MMALRTLEEHELRDSKLMLELRLKSLQLSEKKTRGTRLAAWQT